MKKQNEKSNTVKDATSYAKHLGYQGEKQVLVVDGLVISHKNQSWTSFCDCLREQNAHHSFDRSVLDYLPDSQSIYPLAY